MKKRLNRDLGGLLDFWMLDVFWDDHRDVDCDVDRDVHCDVDRDVDRDFGGVFW